MKRIIIALLVLCFILALTACGQVSNPENQDNLATTPQPVIETPQPVIETPHPVITTEDDSNVENKEITIAFSFGTRTGIYSGPLNEDGMPEGKGTFTAKNSEGTSWTYTGDFVNGHFEGEGEATWSSSDYKEIGQYSNDVIQPLDPSFVSKVYQNPDEYLYHCIEVSGKVYNVGDKDYFQMYEDLESTYGGNNTIVYYDSTDYTVKEGDFVKFIAIVLGEVQYQNVLGNNMTALELTTSEIQNITYVEAAFPTIRSIDVHESQILSGYSITIEKIEFAEKETRVYFSAENGGKGKMSLYPMDIEAEQNHRQYEAQTRYTTDYPQLPNGIRVGNIAEGIISFPPLEQSDFNVYIQIRTDDMTEHIEEMVFTLSVPPLD